ncbi:MAG: HEPN domain-containing protein [Candidatus Altiarchaeales archaeon HGW-Altiarchaeales-3]|nr:MAG: HEPN domain-containing protein [Candidatus Altiarchaeales archaeon HGW-Altiarchaeales-3]
MDEINELLKRSEEKLQSSISLLEKGHYGDAISRAYYCMYYASRALLLSRNIHPTTHKGVINEMWKNFGKTGLMDKDLFKALASSQTEREEADYGIYTTFSEEETKKVIDDAQNFLKKCKELLKNELEML